LDEVETEVLAIKSEISERVKMSVTAEEARSIMREAITDCAWPVSPGQPQKVWLRRVARAVNISFNRLHDIYAGETIPRWHEGATILKRAEERRRLIARWKDLQAAMEIGELEVEQSRIERNVADNAGVHALATRSTDSPDQGLPGLR
jgi:hypothetical protein